MIIAIFSSRDYAGKWFPPENEKNIIFRNNDVYCTNCFKDEKNNNFCLRHIAPTLDLNRVAEIN